IPATILSRTQRFDFQRIKDTDLIAHMSEILKFENRSYDDEALALIARCAKGGMRDALSLLDQALSFSQERLDLETALSVTGSFSQQLYCQYIEAVFAKESG
ncbi:DNA polymerase III subunit gamma/tau, partial [Veillonellaceae bacterium M2-4]|nr:DNA polymerase III subunit gamma/tau [Veillonellaceae bacterium M2-4]